ncbi:MAG: ATP-binding protein [Christensenellales bacterium]
MNEKQKVLEGLKKSKTQAEYVARQNFDIAMQSEEYRRLYLDYKALTYDIAKLEYEKKNCSEQKKKLKELKINLDLALGKLGMNADDLKPQYNCKRCMDTGYVDGKECNCFKKKLSEMVLKDIGVTVNPQHTFENVDYSLFDKPENGQKMFEKISHWCETFGTSKYKNLLLTGTTGVGKTYLVESICNKLLSQNVSVMFLTAFALNNLFLKFHTTFDSSKTSILEQVLGCDVLIIDDLGSEPKYKNVTEEYMYLVTNERLSKNQSTIITTNLGLEGVLSRYGERTFSRLCNKQNSIILKIENSDIRLKRKR